MAWTRVEESPLLYTATGVWTRDGAWSQMPLPVTSTSTVVIREDRWPVDVPRLRMFFTGAGEAAKAVDARRQLRELPDDDEGFVTTLASWSCAFDPALEPACAPARAADGYTCPDGYFAYLDSGARAAEGKDCRAGYTSYDPTLAMVVDQLPGAATEPSPSPDCGSVGTCGSYPLKRTCIPTMFRNDLESDAPWNLEEYDYGATLAWLEFGLPNVRGFTTASPTHQNANYKDPHVLPLPGGGWLMVVVRQCWVATLAPPEATEHNCTPAPQPPPAIRDQFCDIVGWWSPVASFDSGQERGPFLLVSALAALPDCPARFWLGVPAATVATGEADPALHVYYMVEPQYEGDADYDAVVEWWGNNVGREPFVAGPAVKRIALDTLYAAIGIGAAAPGASVDQSSWTRDDAVEGELLGQVRLWITHPRIGPEPYVWPWRAGFPAWPALEFFEDAMLPWAPPGILASTPPKIADPVPVSVTIDGAEHLPWHALAPRPLKLYFAAIRSAALRAETAALAGNGYGAWCAAGLPHDAPPLYWWDAEGTQLTQVNPVFGVDFLVCTTPVASTGLPRDMIAGNEVGTTGQEAAWLDPDPVRDPVDGTWRVHVGNTASGLTLFVGLPHDGDRAWNEAWCRDDDVANAAPPAGPPDDDRAVAQHQGDRAAVVDRPAPGPDNAAPGPGPGGCGCGPTAL